MLKRLSDEFFTFVPERLSSFWIERIPARTFAYRVDGQLIGNDLANVTVLANLPAILFPPYWVVEVGT